jgi:Ca2+/Na+ antiporter
LSNSLWLFAGGIISFVVFFLLPRHPNFLSLSGWILFGCAYFLVLLENYKKGTPVPALGHWIDKKNQSRLYGCIYLLMCFFGIFALFVLLLLHVFDR